MRNGQEVVLDTDQPIWVIFENSVVWHAPVSSESLRPTIELDLLPAAETNLDPFYAGMNGLYPWFPTEEGLLEGTRTAIQMSIGNRRKRKSLFDRLLRRAP
jgi:hypothetical protein